MNQLIKMPSNAPKTPSERLFTKSGALVLKRRENAVEAKIGVLYTINGGEDGEEIDYRIYERIKHSIMQTEARFVETTPGTIIAVNQITKLDTKTVTILSKDEKERIEHAKRVTLSPVKAETDEERRANSERLKAKLKANGIYKEAVK